MYIYGAVLYRIYGWIKCYTYLYTSQASSLFSYPIQFNFDVKMCLCVNGPDGADMMMGVMIIALTYKQRDYY
jgi:hypothetical protein